MRRSVSVCARVCVCVRLASCFKEALLLAPALAGWLQIKSRAGAVYVTWGRASEAPQQPACLFVPLRRCCLFVRLSDSYPRLRDIFLPVCGLVCFACLVSHVPSASLKQLLRRGCGETAEQIFLPLSFSLSLSLFRP